MKCPVEPLEEVSECIKKGFELCGERLLGLGDTMCSKEASEVEWSSWASDPLGSENGKL